MRDGVDKWEEGEITDRDGLFLFNVIGRAMVLGGVGEGWHAKLAGGFA